MTLDLAITNGTILDGSGQDPFVGDVAIENGRIADIGVIELPVGVPTLDATDLYVAPGFVHIHGHSDFTLVVDPRAVSSITQGVTLEIVGNRGHGCAPIRDPKLARSNIYGCPADHSIPWRGMAEYLDRLEAGRPAVNVATLVPNGLFV